MSKHGTKSKETREKTGLRNRIRSFYRHFNQQKWQRCFEYLDPALRTRERVDSTTYADSLAQFRARFGPIEVYPFMINVYERGTNKRDARDFAYAYVAWRDTEGNFHMFRERWIKDRGRWYTRVVGLVAPS